MERRFSAHSLKEGLLEFLMSKIKRMVCSMECRGMGSSQWKDNARIGRSTFETFLSFNLGLSVMCVCLST